MRFYLLPELAADNFAAFRAARDELANAYASSPPKPCRTPAIRVVLPFRLVESMIMMRSDDQHSNSYSAADLTDTILRGHFGRAQVAPAALKNMRTTVGLIGSGRNRNAGPEG